MHFRCMWISITCRNASRGGGGGGGRQHSLLNYLTKQSDGEEDQGVTSGQPQSTDAVDLADEL